MNIGIDCCSTLAQVKQTIAEELNIDERMEMRLFSYKGYQLTQDSDLDVLLNNCALFVLIGSIIKLLLDANFDPHNYLVPYTQIKSLGKVIIG